MLYVICTRLCPGHLSVCVGDSSWRCEEIVKKSRIAPLNAIIIIIIMTATWVCRCPFGRFTVDTGARIAQSVVHGWEIAVILRNFRKTKLSKSIFFFFTLFQHVYNVRLDDFRFATYAKIAFRHFTALRPPSSFAHA